MMDGFEERYKKKFKATLIIYVIIVILSFLGYPIKNLGYNYLLITMGLTLLIPIISGVLLYYYMLKNYKGKKSKNHYLLLLLIFINFLLGNALCFFETGIACGYIRLWLFLGTIFIGMVVGVITNYRIKK